MSSPVLAFDLGGTKLLGGVVSPTGELLASEKVSVDFSGGPEGVCKQVIKVSQSLLSKNEFSSIKVAGLASAGPLDPAKGLWLNPTNMFTGEKHWGVFPVIESLQQGSGLDWHLENDAAAAMRAEVWLGAAQGLQNALVLTLGTGLGVGVWVNGQLLRSGRGLHPEAGHIIIEYKEKEVLCGCGNYGCAEAYLSGANFTQWLSKRWQRPLIGEDLLRLAEAGDKATLNEFRDYGRRLAIYLTSLVVLFGPEKIILAGGFSHASPHFLPSTTEALRELLKSRRDGVDLWPHIEVSGFQDEAGLLGAAHVALQKGHATSK